MSGASFHVVVSSSSASASGAAASVAAASSFSRCGAGQHSTHDALVDQRLRGADRARDLLTRVFLVFKKSEHLGQVLHPLLLLALDMCLIKALGGLPSSFF